MHARRLWQIGVVAVCTDELNQNKIFKDNEEIVIIEPTVSSILNKVGELCNN